MTSFRLIAFFVIGLLEWISLAQGAPAEGTAVSDGVREPRSFHKRKLCRKYGICQGYGGHQGNQGNQGYSGYQGNQGNGGYPINIAISQSQSSANEGGGGYAQGHYPNNYQYNGGYPNQGYGGYNYGYNGYKPGYYGNGQGSYNNQFNGNYYGGFKPYSGLYDENDESDDNHEEDYYSRQNVAGAYAKAGTNNN